MAERVCIAQIGAAHGVRGEVRLKAFTADPLGVTRYGALETRGRHAALRDRGRAAREGHAGRAPEGRHGSRRRRGADELRLYVPRERLPQPADDEFYHADLVGLAAMTANGAAFGTVKAVHNFGAGDLLEIEPAGGGATVMLPFTEATVPAIDIAGRTHRGRAAGGCRDHVARDRAHALSRDVSRARLALSLAGKALAKGLWALDAIDIRDHATDRHRTVDDTPAGGGPGMVMKADVLARAIDAARRRHGRAC